MGWGREGSGPLWGVDGVNLAAEAVANVCDAVGAGPYLVVGYSMGGRVALALAGRRPDLMRDGGGLVLVSANPGLKRYELTLVPLYVCVFFSPSCLDPLVPWKLVLVVPKHAPTTSNFCTDTFVVK